MPIRIYKLAKELNLDSKDLVDACKKVGIVAKGSALASLTDEEVATVRSYLSGSSGPQPDTSAPPARRAPASPSAVSNPSVEQPVVSTSAVKTGKPPVERKPPVESFTRDDYIGPGGSGRKPKVLGASNTETAKGSSPPLDESKKKSDSPLKREPVVKLAAIPRSDQPKPTARKLDEPAPQKPIMTLPPDAIRGAKAGSKAPLQGFTRQQDKKRGKAEGPPKVGRSEPQAKVGQESTARGKRDRKRGKVGGVGEERLAGMASTRVARQQHRRRSVRDYDDGDNRRRRSRLTRKGTNTAAPRKGDVVVELPCTVRTLSEATGVSTAAILRSLMAFGTMANINAELDLETAELIAAELGIEVQFKEVASLEDRLINAIKTIVDPADQLEPRAPVVTFLGHVDHGKTSLLDRLIGIDVVSGEAGGITQHIRAYRIQKDGRAVAFVDTPGHEAFTEMRVRGANVTDIAVLVVAADDGVMPQTEEAISHAKAAEVPIVVALNKIDLPGADVNKAYQDLSAHELLPVEWGGDVEVVKTSAITGDGLDELFETLLLTADLHEYKANAKRAAFGTCLEAQQEGDRGVVAKVMVQNGTLRVGDVLVCGSAYGRVKAMYNTLNGRRKEQEAGPSTPVNLTGLDVAPAAGESFYVFDNIAQARSIAEQRQVRERKDTLSGHRVHISFEEFQRRLEEGLLGARDEVATLNLILRADVRGSIEAIEKEMSKLEHPEVKVRMLQKSVGGISVADVTLADASDAVIVGFNVIPDEAARTMADKRGVEIRRYNIIYKVTEDIRALLEGKLKPEERESDLGRALVQQVFTISRLGSVAGCRVLAGKIERGCRVRVNRDGRGIGDYLLDSLRREKDDTKEVREGFECGMKLAGFNDLKEGDILEAYKVVEISRTL